MPLDATSVITTVGGSTANSYVTPVEFQSYRDLNVLDADAFDGATPDRKIRALFKAANRLQRENWLGNRASDTQRLAWPRAGAQKVDAVGGSWFDGYPGYAGFGATYSSTEIPQQVKDAQCELALAYLAGFDDGEEDAIDSFAADGVSVKFRDQKPSGGLPPTIQQLIGGLIAGNRLRRA